jgi:hypothetical protein
VIGRVSDSGSGWLVGWLDKTLPQMAYGTSICSFSDTVLCCALQSTLCFVKPSKAHCALSVPESP